MSGESIKQIRLDDFLRNVKGESKEIFFKTSIRIGKISNLRTGKVNLYLYDFFLIAKSVNADLNEMAEKIFRDYEPDVAVMQEALKGTRKKGELGKFGAIIDKYLNSQRSLAQVMGIDKNKYGFQIRNGNHLQPSSPEHGS